MPNESLLNQLKRHEGLRLRLYKDSVGIMTIGYGRNIEGKGISKAEAEFMLGNDIKQSISDVKEFLPWTCTLDPVRFDVLANMCFNLGIAGLLKFMNTLEMIKDGYYEKASSAMLKSKWAEQVGPRAIELANQMMTGKYQDE